VTDLVHPIAFAVYPVLALLASNIEETRPSAALRPLVASLAIVLILLLLLQGILRNGTKAAILASIAVVAVFTYGHFYGVLKQVPFPGPAFARHRYLVPALTFAVVGAGWVITRTTSRLAPLRGALVVAALTALLLPAATITIHLASSRSTEAASLTPAAAQVVAPPPEELPDVYYIILDAYARSDVLRDVYGYDNSPFLAFLDERGFYIADESTSNYSLTRWSLASSLNMAHLADRFQSDEIDKYGGALNHMIQDSLVLRQFKELGYQTVALATGWPPTEIRDVDIFITPEDDPVGRSQQAGQLNAFESMWLQSTPVMALNAWAYERNRSVPQTLAGPYVKHRDFILGQFGVLDNIAGLPSPKFVFVHIIAPHAPYVFGPDGRFVSNPDLFTLGDLGDTDMDPAERGLYRDQTIYITERIRASLEEILADSASPPIVIVQGDHGAKVNIDWEDPSDQKIREAMSILNAYLLPDRCLAHLDPAITPVNTFVVIFDCVYGLRFGRQPEESYFSGPDSPLDLVDVTKLLH
jgi:hypothetical protein